MPKKPQSATATPNPRSPMPARVQEDAEQRPEDAEQRPVAVTLYGVSVPIESIEERWEDAGDWWKDNPVVRVSYQVTLEDGQQLKVFRNMLTGGWYQVSYETK